MSEHISDDELQTLWNDQPEHLNIPNMKELTMSLQNDHRKEQKRLLFLNLQEVIPAVGLSLWLGWKGLDATSNAWAWFAAAIISVGVAAYLVAGSLRQRRIEQHFDDTARGEVQRSLSQMQHRARLYRTVAWWYLGPVSCAIVLMLIGGGADFAAPGTMGYLAVAAALMGGLYYWNRKIGREKYETKVEHFSNLLAQLG